MARWITVHKAFDYRFPDRSAILHFAEHPQYPFPREEYVKDEIAEFAIKRGYATEGKASGSTTKSRKGKTERPKRARTAGNASTANRRPNARVGSADVPAAGGAGDGNGVDQASS
jgi:hypothetical protein